MKECPKCHTQYDDTMNFCQKDGCQLQNMSSSSSSSSDSSSSAGTSDRVDPKPPRPHSILKTVLIIVAVICGAGLYWYFSQPVYTIYPEISKYEVKVEGESFIMPIHTDAPYPKWEATCSESWVDITRTAEAIAVVCDANMKEERTATIYLRCDDRKNTKETIKITQAEVRYTIYPEMSKYEVKGEGESFVMPIHTDAPYSKWEATCSESWVDITRTAEVIAVVCDANMKEERTATIYLKCDDRENTQETIKITQADGRYGTADGHEYVNLGLSVNWATCNVGANRPENYGDYYAWGETRTKSEYTSENSETYDRPMSDISGRSSYDVARYKWGGKWRMPTKAELQELKENTTPEWAERDGVKGLLCTSKKNGATIFLPNAGYRDGTSLYDAGEGGDYWSSSPDEDNDSFARFLSFGINSLYWCDGWSRFNGRSVRPVREK